MWFRYGLKAQKLLEAARPERAEAPSPGHRPGYKRNPPCALKGQKLKKIRVIRAYFKENAKEIP